MYILYKPCLKYTLDQSLGMITLWITSIIKGTYMDKVMPAEFLSNKKVFFPKKHVKGNQHLITTNLPCSHLSDFWIFLL